ncbi:hypothetical protein [Streptomyces vinaceus]|uniref:hypothetical protein n=1 Tax=Streptomyces vinaceus TaxID=1960 RepID=UPI0038226607
MLGPPGAVRDRLRQPALGRHLHPDADDAALFLRSAERVEGEPAERDRPVALYRRTAPATTTTEDAS